MESFTKALLVKQNMVVYEIVTDKILNIISAAAEEGADEEGFWGVENLKRVVQEAEVDKSAAAIKACLGVSSGSKSASKPSN